jgi:hypothetical protein
MHRAIAMANTETPKATTAIPQLVAMELRDDEFNTVIACPPSGPVRQT